MNETSIQTELRLEASRLGMFLWRNNSGACRDVTGRVIRYGLGNDSARLNEHFKSSDLVGFTPMLITQEHVGKTVAVFTGVECKRSDWRGHPTDKREIAQQAFLDTIKRGGGMAGFATSVSDLYTIIGDW